VSPRNVTGLVDGLAESGFVTREPHPTDRRATLVALTERARASKAQMDQGARDAAVRRPGGSSTRSRPAWRACRGRRSPTWVPDVGARRGRLDSAKRVHVEDGIQSVPVLKQTRVGVKLQEPIPIGNSQITEVRLYADDPKGFVASARERLGSQALLTPRRR
jgi:hypothetical protein